MTRHELSGKTRQVRRRPSIRRAAISSQALTVSILVCVAVIACAYLVGLMTRGGDRLSTGIAIGSLLGLLFLVLDVLVILRLARPVAAAVTKRLAPASIGKALLGTLALAALALSVVAFFLLTCVGMMQTF